MPRLSAEILGRESEVWRSLPALSCLSLLLVAALGSPFAGRLLGGTVGRFAGQVSYSMYLVHFPLLFALATVRPASTETFFALYVGAVLVASWITWTVVERPARDAINAYPWSSFAGASLPARR
jgi:peptidoglycan/LPS O-acetylase OafA/YrhL